MKNYFALIGIAFVISVSFSCKNKNTSNSISPDYGATGNPYPNNQTVTGSTTYTSPATQNTTFEAGGIGWTNPTCASSASMALRTTKDNVDVIITFASAITSNTYAISSIAGPGSCVLTVYNAPNQPAGVYWYAKTGHVVVSITPTSINANLVGVVCTQKEFNFPQVSITGALGCAGQ